MEVYGLTGGIGSGKSAVCDLLEEYGIPVVSADELARVVVAPGTEGLGEVIDTFGEEVLGADGELDRQAMARIIFADPEARARLEAIIHPRVRERFADVLRVLESAGNSLVIYEIPLLFEKGLESTVAAVIVVAATEDVRVDRVVARSKISPEEVRQRMSAQVDDATRRAKADYVIHNNGDRVDLRREVERMITKFLRPRAAAYKASKSST